MIFYLFHDILFYITAINICMQEFSLHDFSRQPDSTELIASLCLEDSIEIKISYLSDFRSAKVLRELVDTICKNYWVNPRWRTRLVLIIDELNNNAIEYGSKTGESNVFVLILKKDNQDSFYVESYVSDTWNGAHSKTSQDMEDLRLLHKNKDFSNHNSIRGRGLFLIISQLVDTLYFKDNDNWWLTVGIQKSLEVDPKK